MSKMMSGKWLSEGFDELIANEPELLDAWDTEGYPGQPEGEGNWTVLYLGQTPIGVLWLSMDTGGCDIEPVAGMNIDVFTLEQLRIRFGASQGTSAAATYADVAERYRTSEEDTGNLDVMKGLILSVP